MNFYLQTLSETAQIVLPIFLLLISGFLLRRLKVIDTTFVDQASRLVFSLTLPILIFLSVAQADFFQLFSARQLTYVYTSTCLAVLLIYFCTRKLITAPADQGVFTQGAFRGNFGIIGLAVVFNMLGSPGLPPAALLLALIIPLYNVLSIIVLSLSNEGGLNPKQLLISIIRNPLILAVAAALPFSMWSLPMPELLKSTGSYFADLTLPLALLTIGASLDLKYLGTSSKPAIHASLLKLVTLPILLTFGAYLTGFRGNELAILFVLFGSPTAAASFVMAKVMGGNGTLAANIVALTTLGSILTLGTGIYLLKILSL
ncbi:AEC family transporter [Motiliproteus sp. MSK22-1]|uniref:AEC family transporter n=1 Tax=Motiliproteus sp. MSK22-1 TaxID=1897630 RepID=UPI000975EBB4|nr:AEC family transporter [Motiliproteus sp. MSK22-1]OMH39059.1 transporter [Motiliproteus sp. MSK22-1]